MYSVDPHDKIDGVPLGSNAAILKVDKVLAPDIFLWRPSAKMAEMGDAVNNNIRWPLDKVEFSLKTPSVSPKSSPASTSNSIGSNKESKKKCLLYDCSGSKKIVTEGPVCSTPDDRVHFVPLGPNATKVWVDVAKIGDAAVWRPNSEIQFVAIAIGTTIAWPNEKLKLVL